MGVHMDGKCHPGLTRSQILEQCPDIIIDDSLKEIINDEKGWFTRTTLETPRDLFERQKDLLRDLKEMHRSKPDETILMISHGQFLASFMLLITGQLNLHSVVGYIPRNNSLTIVDFTTQWNEK